MRPDSPGFIVLLAGLALALQAVRADETAHGTPGQKAPANGASAKAQTPPPDPEMIEFLGSVDNGDNDWIDYLATADVGKASKTKVAGDRSEVTRDE